MAHTEISEWDDDRDLNSREAAVGVFVAGVKTHKKNGATRFIPGSHLWGNERKPNEADCFYAELEAGDAFFMLASCYHGGSANTTTDEWRLVYGTFCTRGCKFSMPYPWWLALKKKLNYCRDETGREPVYHHSERSYHVQGQKNPEAVRLGSFGSHDGVG